MPVASARRRLETGFVRYLLLNVGFEGRFDTITGRPIVPMMVSAKYVQLI